MTSFDLVAIVQELEKAIVGSRIDNIYQVSPLTFLFSLHPKQSLIVEAGKYIYLTQYEVEKPRFPSLFCRILRKFLRRGVVEGVQLDGFERIVTIESRSKEASYRFVCEIFGKGNVILTEDDGIILHALSYRKMRDRNIVRGEYLSSPPPRGYNPLEITRQEFENLRKQQGDVVRALTRMLAVGGLYAEELLLRARVDKGRDVSSLTREEAGKIFDEVINLVSSIKSVDPHIVVDGSGRWVDVLPFPLRIYSNYSIESYPTYNLSADEYFTRLAQEHGSTYDKEMDRNIDQQKRILNQQKERLKSLILEENEKRNIGDAIYLHAFDLQNLFHQIEEKRTRGINRDQIIVDLHKQEDNHKTSTVHVDAIIPERRTMIIKINDLSFEMNLRRSVFENASFFYEEAKASKAKIERLKKTIVETEDNINRLKTSHNQYKRDEPPPVVKMRKRSWFEKFHWAESSEDLLIIGGRDSTTNELLIKKYTHSNDLVFHADISGAPFVVLKTEGKAPSNQSIFEAAQLSASYSRGWKEGWASLDVYWINPEQVSKQAPSGEYLSKGMFMVRGQKNYIRNVPLRVSIGVMEKDGKIAVIGGPVSAINTHSQYRVEIVPGRHTSGKMAKEIRNTIATFVTKELRNKILRLKLEDIQRFIPAGKSEIAIR
jgi:predicted ribosome quality control (RQC) complex YloA/Tae2 family protein